MGILEGDELKEFKRIIIGAVIAVIGTCLAFYYAITPESPLDWTWIIVGIALLAGYCVISWEWVKVRFGKDASTVLLTPPLVTFGILSIYVSVFTIYFVPPHDKVFLGLGAALIVVPLALLGKALKK